MRRRANGGRTGVRARLLADGRDVRVVDVTPENEPRASATRTWSSTAIFCTGFRGAPRPERPLIARSTGSPPGCGGVRPSASTLPPRDRGRGGRRRTHGHLHARSSAARRAGTSTAGRSRSRTSASTTAALRTCSSLRLILALVPAKRDADHKYTAGAVLVFGGSRGSQVPLPCSRAAFRPMRGTRRSRARLVAAGARGAAARGRQRPLTEDWEGRVAAAAIEEIVAAAERMRAVCAGPGLGRSDDTQTVVRRVSRRASSCRWSSTRRALGVERTDRRAERSSPLTKASSRVCSARLGLGGAHRLEALSRAVERFRCIVLLKVADRDRAPASHARRLRNVPALALQAQAMSLTGSSRPSSPGPLSRAWPRRGGRRAPPAPRA